ncbi:hypothetical protein [Treponema endosymbiont of Eucomonympha sp.]|uniref:hypothetical protein n=1 Tax=Treponema endosymbiont of Eucomonympha sp. TaxID=1580831 RepID=UPI00075094E9|nr:hypothetical protein [Treponema endosymbiont of Eucomonympha sp.]
MLRRSSGLAYEKPQSTLCEGADYALTYRRTANSVVPRTGNAAGLRTGTSRYSAGVDSFCRMV